MKNKTILFGLNELNIEYILFYIDKGLLPNFKKLFEFQKPIETISENEYSLLEPWVQWVTIHTGKSFSEHNIFRLGDIVNKPDVSQIFEELEDVGCSVGAVSPFNAENRLKSPSYFIPDPWTKTPASGNWLIKSLYKAIHQSVNDNAKSKLSFKSLTSLILGILFYVPVSRWFYFFMKFLKVKDPGTKAIVLDSLLSDIHFSLWKKYKPNFSNLFLNAGAHIQHHYLFNSQAYKGDLQNPSWYCPENYDPLIQILSEYDYQIGRILSLNSVNLIIATGLHQKPHQRLTYYWRLNEHVKFLKLICIHNFDEVLPRMSRDFLINFNNEQDTILAEQKLNCFYASKDKNKIFNVDNRGTSLFVELVYPNDLSDTDTIYSKNTNQIVENFKCYVSFVAIKNGEHDGVGYLISNKNLRLGPKVDLKDIKDVIKKVVLNQI